MWRMRMQMLTKRKRTMEIAQIIDNALEEYYSEHGQTRATMENRKIRMVV